MVPTKLPRETFYRKYTEYNQATWPSFKTGILAALRRRPDFFAYALPGILRFIRKANNYRPVYESAESHLRDEIGIIGAAALPNSAAALPNSAAALPDSAAALPDSAAALHDATAALHDTAAVAHDTAAGAHDTAAALHNGPGALHHSAVRRGPRTGGEVCP